MPRQAPRPKPRATARPNSPSVSSVETTACPAECQVRPASKKGTRSQAVRMRVSETTLSLDNGVGINATPTAVAPCLTSPCAARRPRRASRLRRRDRPHQLPPSTQGYLRLNVQGLTQDACAPFGACDPWVGGRACANSDRAEHASACVRDATERRSL